MPTSLLPVVGPDSPETHSILTIQRAKLKDQHLTSEFTEQRDEESPARAFAVTCQEQVHPDLPHAFSRLVPHLCLLTEQLTETPDYWPDEAEDLPTRFASFTVTGFSMGKNQGGVTLIGQRELAGGRVLNLTSPYTAFEDENSTYQYPGQLETIVLNAIAEVEAALRGKASEAGRQLYLFDTSNASAQLTAD
jgi:hypothetical protein